MNKKIVLLVFCALFIILTSCGRSKEENSVPKINATEKAVDYKNNDGMGFTVRADGTLEVSLSGNNTEVTVPKKHKGIKVTSIGKSAFRMSDVTKVTLPDTIEKIDSHAFAFATSLKEINIPEGVTEIGNNAFMGCMSLENIALPENVETIGMYAFDGSGLTEITLPSNVTKIYDYAFAECEYLKNVTFEGTTVEIADTSFQRSSDVFFYVQKGSDVIGYAKSKGIEYKIK